MSQENLSSVPLYRKALDLCKMSREIASYVTYNKDLLKLYQSNSHRDIIADSLLTDAILIPQQIAYAEYSNCHASRMKSATYISIMTRNILSYCKGLEMDGVKEKEYLNLLRIEIRSFRRLYHKWKKSLRRDDSSNSWGLGDSFGF